MPEDAESSDLKSVDEQLAQPPAFLFAMTDEEAAPLVAVVAARGLRYAVVRTSADTVAASREIWPRVAYIDCALPEAKAIVLALKSEARTPDRKVYPLRVALVDHPLQPIELMKSGFNSKRPKPLTVEYLRQQWQALR